MEAILFLLITLNLILLLFGLVIVLALFTKLNELLEDEPEEGEPEVYYVPVTQQYLDEEFRQ